MDLLYSNPYINIRLHPGPPHDTIEIQWLDFVPSADLRASLREMLHLAHKHAVKAWVVDNRLLRAMRTADLAWSATEIMQPMSDLGVRRFSGVESYDGMNRMGVTALLADVIPNTKMTQRFFSTIEEARAWATAPF
ncbi:MAG: hypothetical protein EOO60_04345 [Hymenobacter sp.]|nr:MAG: hypothetical protein EOO60_04345 [Hymenobacter sp.]